MKDNKMIEIKVNKELMTEYSARAIINTIKIINTISYITLFLAGITFIIGAFLEVWNFTKYSLIIGFICCVWLGLVYSGYQALKRI